MTAVVVFVHIHYPETWLPIRDRLSACMNVPFRIVLTTTAEHSVFDPPASEQLVDMEVLIVENRGRDVLPFLNALRAMEPFEIGLKLHGKKSVHRLDGVSWRDALLQSLLPERPETGALVDHMRQDSRVAIVAPSFSLCSIDRHIGRNMGAMRRIARRLGMNLTPALTATPYFAAGTMFWFRREALEPLLKVDFNEDFAVERGQTDGTAAHAFERLFSVVAEQDGRVTVTAGLLKSMNGYASAADMRHASKQMVDIDTTHVRRPGRLGAFALRYLWFVTPIYAALPEPLRRRIKRVLRPSASRGDGRPAA
jgi:lipopolysaccharide biosynthesis protein